MKISSYLIQDWLFKEAEGRFDIDLAESGIQPNRLTDLSTQNMPDLNYSIDRGGDTLRQSIAKLYGINPDNVVITNGSQEALFLLYLTLLEKDDHVITFVPGWQQSWEIPERLGCETTKLSLNNKGEYKFDVEQLSRAIKPTTKLIVLNSPNNPTGVEITSDQIEVLQDLLKQNDIMVLNDEVYLSDYGQSIINFLPKSISVGSLSKVYGFPGLRVGWLISKNGEVIESVVNAKRYTTVSNSILSEVLAIHVLDDKDKYIGQYQEMLARGYETLVKWLKNRKEFSLTSSTKKVPFVYLRLNIKMTSLEFCKKLLEQEKVLLMPAEVFDDEKAVRLSFGRPLSILEQGLSKISHFCDSLKG